MGHHNNLTFALFAANAHSNLERPSHQAEDAFVKLSPLQALKEELPCLVVTTTPIVCVPTCLR
jgi:hypothetical protein